MIKTILITPFFSRLFGQWGGNSVRKTYVNGRFRKP